MSTVSKRGDVLRYADPTFHREWKDKQVAEYWAGKPQALPRQRVTYSAGRSTTPCSSAPSLYPSTAATSRTRVDVDREGGERHAMGVMVCGCMHVCLCFHVCTIQCIYVRMYACVCVHVSMYAL